MITTPYSALDGLVTFECGFRTPGTDNKSFRLYTALKAAVSLTPSEQRDAATLTSVLAATRGITIAETDVIPPQVQGLKDFWDFVSSRILIGTRRVITESAEDIAEMWELFTECVSSDLWKAWLEAYSNANVLYPASNIAKPAAALTDAERNDEELKKSDSNTPEAAANGLETSPSP